MNMQIIPTNYQLTVFVKTLFVFVFFSLYSCTESQSQNCKIKANKVGENSHSNLLSVYDFGGSTFVACKTGVVTTVSFKVHPKSETQSNAMFFMENGIGNGVVESGSQTYADYVQGNVSIPGKGGSAVVKLKEPFPVQAGETYTWYVQKDPDAGPLVQAAGLAPENGFEGGSLWFNNRYYRDVDNVFTVTIK